MEVICICITKRSENWKKTSTSTHCLLFTIANSHSSLVAVTTGPWPALKDDVAVHPTIKK